MASLKDLVADVRGRAHRIEAGDIDEGIWTADLVIFLIHDIQTVGQGFASALA